jgi:hypothetical protein
MPSLPRDSIERSLEMNLRTTMRTIRCSSMRKGPSAWTSEQAEV